MNVGGSAAGAFIAASGESPEPPSTDPNFFTGRALTYYGRWTYKYEEATRHGAAAVVIIHTTPTASCSASSTGPCSM